MIHPKNQLTLLDKSNTLTYTNRHSSSRMSSLDLLGDIPRGERILLKIFLRNTMYSKEEFTQLAKTLPEKKNLSPIEINAALVDLLNRDWLSEDGENYTLLQRKRQGSKERE